MPSLKAVMLSKSRWLVGSSSITTFGLISITAFNDGMISFPGIVLMTTHDHQFMQTTANRIIEITPAGMIDRLYTYDEYLLDKRVKELQEEMYQEQTV